MQNVPYGTVTSDREEHMTNGRTFGRLHGFKHRVPTTNSFEHRIVRGRMLCYPLGAFPEQLTLRREDKERMGGLL